MTRLLPTNRTATAATNSQTSAVYRPREALESDFHRLLRERFEEFRGEYGERYGRQFGYWRPIMDKAVGRFLACGDLRYGFARVRCGECRHEFLVAFSCKQRCVCPSCAQKRTVVFGLHLADEVCRFVPHRQFVWTIPKRLRVYFRFHRELLGRLPKLAWETVREVYGALLGPGARPGGIIAIQTFGSLLHFHPHLHGLITDGAFTKEGHFVPVPLNLTHEPFLRLWEQKVFGLLLEEGLIQPGLVQQMLSWRHSGFHVDRSVVLARGDRKGIEQLGQYLARCPFSLSRLVRITEEGQVVYKADKEGCQEYPEPVSEDLQGGVARNYQVFEPLDFLAELTQHIPNKGEHLIRYYGCYSNKARRKKADGEDAAMAACRDGDAGSEAKARGERGTANQEIGDPEAGSLLEKAEAQGDKAARRRWAMLIQRIYHVDPLVCPQCGGRMKIIAFIEGHQAAVIQRILRHCGLWKPPPAWPPPRPPPRCQPAAPGPGRRPSHSPWPAAAERYAGNPDLDPDFLEHLHRQAQGEQLELPWD